MSEGKVPVQSDAQAGSSGQAAGVGSAVGGVRNSEDISWLDLWALNPETRAYLRSARRDAACSDASSRREGAGDGWIFCKLLISYVCDGVTAQNTCGCG